MRDRDRSKTGAFSGTPAGPRGEGVRVPTMFAHRLRHDLRSLCLSGPSSMASQSCEAIGNVVNWQAVRSRPLSANVGDSRAAPGSSISVVYTLWSSGAMVSAGSENDCRIGAAGITRSRIDGTALMPDATVSRPLPLRGQG